MLTTATGALLAAALSVSVLSVTPTPRRLASVQDSRITESSGLVASPTHPGLVWTVNDSGSAATVYGVWLATGRTLAVLRLADTRSRDVQARDMEAMTATRGPDGRGLLWIGDVGDNRGVRESVVLRLVNEPRTVGSASLTPVSLRVRYPDGPHDVETMIWTPDGRLLLVSKLLFGAVIYQVPARAVAAALAGRSTSTPVVAVPVAGVEQSLVTDGAALPDERIVLRGYEGATIYPDPPVKAMAGGQLRALQQVVLPAQPQGETLAVVDDGAAVVVGSEGVRQPLWRVALPAAARPTPASSTAPSSTSDSTPAGTSPAVSPPRQGRPGEVPWPVTGALLLAALAAAAAIARRRRR